MRKRCIGFYVATTVALTSLCSDASAQTHIHIPLIGSSESSPHYHAATKLQHELVQRIGGPWQINEYATAPAASGVVVLVHVDPSNLDPLTPPSATTSETAYRLKYDGLGAADPSIRVFSRSEQGALEGIHGLRLELMQLGYWVTDPSVTIDKTVNPAFERRGFMVLIEEHGYTAAQWRTLIDFHQLAGANTITVGLPGLYHDTPAFDGNGNEIPDPDNRERFESDVYAARQAMLHAQRVGLKFQINTSATMIDTPFFWENFEPAQVLYDAAGGEAVTGSAAVDPLGADPNHEGLSGGMGDVTHSLLYYAAAASLPKVNAMGADPDVGELEDHQEDFYASFEEADAVVLVTTEGATDFHKDVLQSPVAHFSNSFKHVGNQRLGNPSNQSEIVYWGWLHDLWYRGTLQDYDYSKHSGLTTFEMASPNNSYDAALIELTGHNGLLVPPGRAEWVQEVGYHYGNILYWSLTAATLGTSTPQELFDPLGELDTVSTQFDKTAFLYWSHVEPDPRNYLPRPATRATISDLRAAKRLDTRGRLVLGGWESRSAATGAMGYRFWKPWRRPLNDYIVLRLASDESFLGGPTDLEVDYVTNPMTPVDELQPLQYAILDDLARFLAGGMGDPSNPSSSGKKRFDAVQASLRMLDEAQQIFPDYALSPDMRVTLLAGSLGAFLTPNVVKWWEGPFTVALEDVHDDYNHLPDIQDYYHLLAFTYFVEKAALLHPGFVAQDVPPPTLLEPVGPPDPQDCTDVSTWLDDLDEYESLLAAYNEEQAGYSNWTDYQSAQLFIGRALEVAQQTELLEEYSATIGANLKIEGLALALR
jgi:hypothetical protein